MSRLEDIALSVALLICALMLIPLVVVGATLFWRLMFVVVFGVGEL
ncbi:hypothetical protein KLEP181_gp32 [Paracoccus phage vB_PmaP_KLEP18-1]|nr:hypothetical protein KLEP181_gp32 [Paracoccus phage vB_PmaP_KLEP18-1]